MYEYLYTIYIVDFLLLFYSTYQDIRYKAVDDIILYIFFIFNLFSFSYIIFFYNIFSIYIIISYLVLLLFTLLYVFKLLAIGDLYIFFGISILFSFINLNNIISFIFYLVLFAFIFHNIEGLKVYYNKNKKYFSLSLLNIVLLLVAIYIIYLFIYNFQIYYIIYSMILLYISYFIFRIFEKDLRSRLIYTRTVDKLVEGDWIDDNIIISNIPDSVYSKVNRYFNVRKEGDNYILSFKDKNKYISSILIIILSLVPMILYIFNIYISTISFFIILIIYNISQNRLFSGNQGLSLEEINILKELSKYNNIELKVMEGAPFIPPIFLALLLSIL